jgi:hypothetical protein
MTPLQQTILEYSAVISAAAAAASGVVMMIRRICGFLRRVGRVADHLIGDGTPEHPDLLTRIDQIQHDLTELHLKVDDLTIAFGEHQQQPARRAHQRRITTMADRVEPLSG